MSLPLLSPANTADVFGFLIPDVNFQLSFPDLPDVTCNELRYLCASFNVGDTPQPTHGSRVMQPSDLGFHVYGVDDYLTGGSKLVGCKPIEECRGKGFSFSPRISR